jgi:hypothetical protein
MIHIYRQISIGITNLTNIKRLAIVGGRQEAGLVTAGAV